MHITIDLNKPGPIYQQIVDQISRDITLKTLTPGYQLPTVRQLAAESGISPGTIKHAYDTLEQAGLIIKNRGSGTFVASAQESNQKGTKSQAIQGIDEMLARLKERYFSPKDLRIFLELKLREWEEHDPTVSVAAVDCSPEALSVMYQQIADVPHTEVFKFFLEEVLSAPNRFDPGTDVVVTTPTHYEDLIKKMPPRRQPLRLLMGIDTNTASEIAALPEDTRLEVAAASRRFAQIMPRACEGYGKLADHPVKLAFFGEEAGIARLIQDCDRILLPPNYRLFAGGPESALLEPWEQSGRTLHYGYQIERGSLLFLEEQIHKFFKENTLSS